MSPCNHFTGPDSGLGTRLGRFTATLLLLAAGIGKAIAKQLAAQNLNVVLVALPGQDLDGAIAELQKQHRTQQFRKVNASIHRTGG